MNVPNSLEDWTLSVAEMAQDERVCVLFWG
jgi:hypothetical protein